MKESIKVVNELLVELFNEILAIEKNALQKGAFSDLSITEIHVLEAIGLESRTMTEAAGTLGVTVGTLTTSITRLVKKEYVVRKRSEEDRRFVEVQLTKKGVIAYKVHERFHRNMVNAMLEKLSDKDNEILIKSLESLSEFFKIQYHL